MNDRPGWIQLLYDRHTAEPALRTACLLHLSQGFIAGEADAQPAGREQLRKAALDEVESDDPQFVGFSLICLGVVGEPEDLPVVTGFTDHPSDLIQRAARTCLFELEQKKRSATISDD
ncbi:MAG: hypothetical protein WCB27_07100 [Thermoguttaceae bacterium]|jgi:hypothetical protein